MHLMLSFKIPTIYDTIFVAISWLSRYTIVRYTTYDSTTQRTHEIMTTLIVDGYNAINAIARTKELLSKSLRSARSEIIAISREYARGGNIHDVIVVFDGNDKYADLNNNHISPRVYQVFSGTGKGDDKIIETIRKASGKGPVVLASNDNYVRNNARAYGASVIDSRDLVRKKKKTSAGEAFEKKMRGKDKREITEEYKKILGI